MYKTDVKVTAIGIYQSVPNDAKLFAVPVTGGTLGWSIPVTNVPWRTLKPRKGDFWVPKLCYDFINVI